GGVAGPHAEEGDGWGEPGLQEPHGQPGPERRRGPRLAGDPGAGGTSVREHHRLRECGRDRTRAQARAAAPHPRTGPEPRPVVWNVGLMLEGNGRATRIRASPRGRFTES